jgi:hypothetical protein
MNKYIFGLRGDIAYVVRACKTNHPDLPDCSTYGGFHAWWGLIV